MLKSSVRGARNSRKQRKAFPYLRAAKLWLAGKSIATIAHTLGRIDKLNPKDPYHSLRNFLYRMHKHGYRDASGKIVKLPHRVAPSTVKAGRRAGLRAWA
jgi:hypothetical protein